MAVITRVKTKTEDAVNLSLGCFYICALLSLSIILLALAAGFVTLAVRAITS